jgi:hypothetical protein
MDKNKGKQFGKIIVKSLFALLLVCFVCAPFVISILQEPFNPLSRKEAIQPNTMAANAFTMETVTTEETYTIDDLASNIRNFVGTPEGGTDWQVFADTKQVPYIYTDSEDQQWGGFRPNFTEKLQKLDKKEIIIQGFMFPLGPDEKQDMFLLGPFPLGCPFHYHVTPNLIIEVYAENSIAFSYDAVNVKGTLELVPTDDKYNVFYRIRDAVFIP